MNLTPDQTELCCTHCNEPYDPDGPPAGDNTHYERFSGSVCFGCYVGVGPRDIEQTEAEPEVEREQT